jgi:hypothetical protein
MVTIYNTAGGAKPPTVRALQMISIFPFQFPEKNVPYPSPLIFSRYLLRSQRLLRQDKPAAAPLPQAAPKKEIRFAMPTLKQPKPGADELPPPSARGRGRGRGGGSGGAAPEGRANGQGGRGGAAKGSTGAGKPQQQQPSTKAGKAPPQKPFTNGQHADKPAANGSAGGAEGDAKKKRYVGHVRDQRCRDAVPLNVHEKRDTSLVLSHHKRISTFLSQLSEQEA